MFTKICLSKVTIQLLLSSPGVFFWGGGGLRGGTVVRFSYKFKHDLFHIGLIIIQRPRVKPWADMGWGLIENLANFIEMNYVGIYQFAQHSLCRMGISSFGGIDMTGNILHTPPLSPLVHEHSKEILSRIHIFLATRWLTLFFYLLKQLFDFHLNNRKQLLSLFCKQFIYSLICNANIQLYIQRICYFNCHTSTKYTARPALKDHTFCKTNVCFNKHIWYREICMKQTLNKVQK